MVEKMKQVSVEVISAACEMHRNDNEVREGQKQGEMICIGCSELHGRSPRKWKRNMEDRGMQWSVRNRGERGFTGRKDGKMRRKSGISGEEFGLQVAHEPESLLYMFYGGCLAVCLWKCA